MWNVADAANAKRDAETAANVAAERKGRLLDMQRRREILAGIAENPEAGDTARISAILADAKLNGELVEKAETKDTTPREPLEVVRARIAAAKATHGRS